MASPDSIFFLNFIFFCPIWSTLAPLWPMGPKSEKVKKETQRGQLSFRHPPIGETRECKHIVNPSSWRSQLVAALSRGPRWGYDPPPGRHAVPTSSSGSVQPLNTSSSSLWAGPVHKTLLSQPTLSPRITSSFSLQEKDSSLPALDTVLGHFTQVTGQARQFHQNQQLHLKKLLAHT